MKNLTAQELIEIGGGTTQTGSTAGFGISLSANADSLLCVTFVRTYGDYRNITTLAIGKDINLGLGLSGSKQ